MMLTGIQTFLLTVKNKFNVCFPLVRVSRKRVKDKPWLTHNLKSCIKKKHKLYKTSVAVKIISASINNIGIYWPEV